MYIFFSPFFVFLFCLIFSPFFILFQLFSVSFLPIFVCIILSVCFILSVIFSANLYLHNCQKWNIICLFFLTVVLKCCQSITIYFMCFLHYLCKEKRWKKINIVFIKQMYLYMWLSLSLSISFLFSSSSFLVSSVN